MTEKPSSSLEERLRKAGIRHFDELIHDQPKEWLIENFSQGATDYPVNVTNLMMNIVWQTRERIMSGEKPPLNELIRTFWYMYIKPTLARADSLSKKTDQYVQLIDYIEDMVKRYRLMRYKDIGFRDDGQAHRSVGANPNIILFSEKLGHQHFLSDIAKKYRISILALGGKPSVLNVEYFVDSVKETGFNLQRSFYLFSVVDYDTSGWIVRDSFVRNLKFYGISHIHLFDLITPDMLTPDEIMLARYPIRAGKSMRKQNQRWLEKIAQKHYKNQKYLVDEDGTLYGLEAESISAKRMTEKLKQEMVPLIGKEEDFLRIFELKGLNQAIKDLIVHIVA